MPTIANNIRTCEHAGMDIIGKLSTRLIPAIIIGLFLWLRMDVRALDQRVEKWMDGSGKRVEKRLDGLDERLRAMEAAARLKQGASLRSCATASPGGTCRRRRRLAGARPATDPAVLVSSHGGLK